jgi:acylphosphatase
MTEQGSNHHVCFRCLVGGRVQGVFFRASAREQAQRLGLTGYARNLPDGRVEVFACGPAEAVGRLRDWLRTGPPRAEVTGVACEPLPYQAFPGFHMD